MPSKPNVALPIRQQAKSIHAVESPVFGKNPSSLDSRCIRRCDRYCGFHGYGLVLVMDIGVLCHERVVGEEPLEGNELGVIFQKCRVNLKRDIDAPV